MAMIKDDRPQRANRPPSEHDVPGRAPWMAALALAAVILGLFPGRASAQITVADISSTHTSSLLARIERHVDDAVLAEVDDIRDSHLAAGEQLARSLVKQEPESADAHYWLGVVLGIRTENTGGLGKLNLGREVFGISVRVLELDSLHAGGQELMGRVHANIQRLNWVTRRIALSGDVGDRVGDSSWELAIAYFERACQLDPGALAPRIELARIHLERDDPAKGRGLLEEVLAREPTTLVEERMLEEAARLLREHGQG